jgi:hypothetical protein
VRLTKLDQLVRADEAERGPIPADVQAEVDAEMAALDAEAEAVRPGAPRAAVGA